MPSGPVEVLTLREQSRLSTSSSVHSMLESSGLFDGGQMVAGEAGGLEKQLEKNKLRRLAFETGEFAETVPFDSICGIRSRLGVKEWYIGQNCLGVRMESDIIFRKVNLALRVMETAKFLR